MLVLNKKQKRTLGKKLNWDIENTYNYDKLMNYYCHIDLDYNYPDFPYTLYYDDEFGEPIELEHFGNVVFFELVKEVL